MMHSMRVHPHQEQQIEGAANRPHLEEFHDAVQGGETYFTLPIDGNRITLPLGNNNDSEEVNVIPILEFHNNAPQPLFEEETPPTIITNVRASLVNARLSTAKARRKSVTSSSAKPLLSLVQKDWTGQCSD